MDEAPLLKKEYLPATMIYPIRKPEILSGQTYYFHSDCGLEYQVTFGKKRNNYFGNIVNFSVISDDFEDEYSVTNKGDVWKIINTMIEIIRIYHELHPYSSSYEFSGEFKEGENHELPSVRTRLYLRAIHKNVDLRFWKIKEEKNKIILKRKNDR
ncbi:MAG: hypothetical protein ACOCWA_01205 [Bacteroidota bacterium]